MPKLLLIKLFLPIFFVSCSSLPGSNWVVTPDFILEGRIGVRGLDRATSSSIRWLQSGSNFEMTLWGPFGRSVLARESPDYWLSEPGCIVKIERKEGSNSSGACSSDC